MKKPNKKVAIIPPKSDEWLETRGLVNDIRNLVNATHANFIQIGNKLNTAKGMLPHGKWLPWLEDNFGWSEKTAERLMQVAKAFAGKFDTVSNLTIDASALYLLAKPSVPEEVRKEAIKTAEKGEHVTKKKAAEMIAVANPQKEKKKRPRIDWNARNAANAASRAQAAELLRADRAAAADRVRDTEAKRVAEDAANRARDAESRMFDEPITDKPDFKVMLLDLLNLTEQMDIVLQRIMAAGVLTKDASLLTAAKSCTSKEEKLCQDYRKVLGVTDANVSGGVN
jgi:hypothetical protein